VVQVLELPSFHPRTAFEVFRIAGADGAFMAAKTTWDFTTDVERMRTPVERLRHPRRVEPTMIQQSAPLPVARGSALPWEVESLAVTLAPRKQIVGCDGTSHELAFGPAVSSRW
jgi:hypothetical protein